jgi:1-acyl-sn-glycerol-3-phosphate acyltransferase
VRYGFQRFARFVLRHILFPMLLELEVVGRDNIPLHGRLIVMMNHINFLDPILVSAIMPRDIAIMSKIENYDIPFWGKIVEWYGTFPVRRGEVDIRAVRTSIQVLECDEALLLAPEGHRSETGGLQMAYDGMALVATRTHSPIVPIAISGADRFAYCIRRLRRTPITLHIGEPFVLQAAGEKTRREELRQMTREAMQRLAALLPPSYRGLYSDLSGRSTAHTKPYRPNAAPAGPEGGAG